MGTDHWDSGISFTTPNSRHQGEDLEILKRRHVYQEAQEQLPLLVGLEKLEIGKKWTPLNFMACKSCVILLDVNDVGWPSGRGDNYPETYRSPGILFLTSVDSLWIYRLSTLTYARKYSRHHDPIPHDMRKTEKCVCPISLSSSDWSINYDEFAQRIAPAQSSTYCLRSMLFWKACH